MAKGGVGGEQSAVCAEHPMAEGAHYVEMTLLEEGRSGANMGVVGQGFDAAVGSAVGSAVGGHLSPPQSVVTPVILSRVIGLVSSG